MKKLSTLALSILLLLSALCGCTAAPNGQTQASSQPTTAPTVKAEPIEFIDISGRHTDTALFHGNTLVLLLSRIFTDDEYEQNIELKPDYSLIICDIENKKLISDNPLDTADFDYAQMQFSGDKIAVYDEEKGQAKFYDLSGKFIEQTDYTPTDPYNEKPKSSKLITNDFAIFDNYSFLTSDNYTAVVFDKSPDTAYIYKSDSERQIIGGYNTSLAQATSSGIQIDDLAAKKQTCILSEKFGSDSIRTAAMNGDYLFFTDAKYANDDSLISEKPYIMRYYANQKVKSIDITALTADDFEQSDTDLIKSAQEKYNISIKLPKKTSEIPIDDYKFEIKQQTVSKNLAIRELCGYMSKFPSGFFSELKTKYDILIDLYPVTKISDSNDNPIDGVTAGVTAARGDCTVTSIAMTVSSGLMKQTFAHELTHVLEPVFENYFTEKDDWYMWTKLNPDGFDYDYTYDYYFDNTDESTIEYTYQYDGDVNDAYFYDRYAKTFEREDRARIFENLFIACDSETSADWLRSPHLMKKAELICKIIRESFTSVSGSDSVYWEQNLKSAKVKAQETTKSD
ncbi:MAG: hypothetical protein ACI396_01015 [Acutalibacteraceae bacterium]